MEDKGGRRIKEDKGGRRKEDNLTLELSSERQCANRIRHSYEKG